jgi:hypothetical protein
MQSAINSFLFLLSPSSCFNKNGEQWWPQFRGPDGSEIVNENVRPPVKFEEKNLKWKTELPVGFSSPVIWGDKIFLTTLTVNSKPVKTNTWTRVK